MTWYLTISHPYTISSTKEIDALRPSEQEALEEIAVEVLNCPHFFVYHLQILQFGHNLFWRCL